MTSNVSCDGQTDVTSQLQAEINSAVGSQWTLPAGSAACVVTGLQIPANSHITINGELLLEANANASVISTANVNNITIDGSGTIDGNRGRQTQCCIAGISAYNGANITIGASNTRLTIQNVYNWPVNVVQVNGSTMQNLNASNSGDSVEFAANTTNCSATGLQISGINDEGFAFYGGVSNCSIQDSVLSGNSASGVSVLNDGAQPAPSHDLVIQNIQAYGNSLYGVEINTGTGGVGSSYNIQILNSHLYSNGRGPYMNATGTNVTVSNINTN